jgi:hypothetical protein
MLAGYNAAGDTDGMMQSQGHGRAGRRIGVLMALARWWMFHYHGLFGARAATVASAPPAAASASSASTTSGQRFALFGFGEGEKKTSRPPRPNPDIDRPGVDPPGRFDVPANGRRQRLGAPTLRYRRISSGSRAQCALRGGNVVMKVGVEGSVILGPAGGSVRRRPVRLRW